MKCLWSTEFTDDQTKTNSNPQMLTTQPRKVKLTQTFIDHQYHLIYQMGSFPANVNSTLLYMDIPRHQKYKSDLDQCLSILNTFS